MRTRLLGRTGLRVGEVGFGTAPAGIPNYGRTWDPDAPESAAAFTRAVQRAIDLGYTVFDTSPCYGAGRSEELLGEALRGRRQQVVLATKAGWRQENERTILASLEASLRRLRTDYVDLFQIHGDYPDLYGPADVDWILNGGVLAAYERARQQGKARFIGVTSEDPTAVMPLVASGRFDTVQVKYNLIYQEAFHHLLPLCERLNVGVLVMRPTTSGIFRKYLLAYFGAAALAGLDLEALALNYVLSDPRVDCALAGMRSVASVEANARVSDEIALRVDLDWLHERRVDVQPRPWRQPDAGTATGA